MGSVIKIRNKWGIDYYHNGRRIRKVIGDGQSKTLAKQALNSISMKIAEGEYLPNKKKEDIKILEILDTYWEEYLKHSRSSEKVKWLLEMLKEEFGHLPISNLTADKIREFQRKITNGKKRNNENFSPSTANKFIIYLSASINYCVKIGKIRISGNPCSNVKKLLENNVRDIVLSEQEYQSLQFYLPSHLKKIVCFAYYTGCRKSEILNLKKTDVDLINNVCKIRNTKNGEDRHVPIAEPLREMLIPLVTYSGRSEYVFTYKGRNVTDIKKAFHKACIKAGLGNFHFHDLRHTCLTNWHNEGHSHFLIMKASGHKTVSCFKRYLSFNNNDLQKLVFQKSSQQVDSSEKTESRKAV